jgi:thiol-disulfide isomerase/thioredoxin
MIKKLFVILLTLYVSTSYGQDETTLVKKADKVPVFEFEKSPGVKANISDYKGKTVLITFFATWCGPCRQELPEIQEKIYNKYKNNPNFVLLIFGREHNWKEVDEFKTTNKYDMPFFPDPGRNVFYKFATQSIPRNFLISGDGKVVFSSIGYEEKAFKSLQAAIAEQLK